jgi:phosphoglycerate dehydrogenase-like enzyme
MPRFSAHLLFEVEPGNLDYLRQLLDPEIDLSVGPDLPPNPGFSVLVAGVPREEEISASPGLGTLIIPWSGLPRATRELMLRRPEVAVHNIHHNAGAAAELAVALLMAAAKFIVPMDRSLRSFDWSPRYSPNPSVELQGSRVLVLGYGAIGRLVARMCRGLGMNVAAIRRRPERTDAGCPDEIHTVDSLPRLLPETDALIVALPLTRRTEGLVGEVELKLLPRHAVLVNVARGPIVNERALFNSLQSQALKAAGLDVWYNYPKDVESRAMTAPSDYPFHELDNVVLSPHRAGALDEERTEILRMEALARSLNAAARGREIPFPVDVEEGY